MDIKEHGSDRSSCYHGMVAYYLGQVHPSESHGVAQSSAEQDVCLQVSYYSLLPRLTHLAFGMLGSCAIQNPTSAKKLLVSPHITNTCARSNHGVSMVTIFMQLCFCLHLLIVVRQGRAGSVASQYRHLAAIYRLI